MNEHPHESLPAFVLGALDAEDAILVTQHIAICATCRADAEEYRAIVDLLPYTASSQEPPPHVKHQLFARVNASIESAAITPAAQRNAGGWTRTLSTISAISLLLVVVLALTAAGMYRNLRSQNQMLVFLMSTETVSQKLQHTEQAPSAEGKMYMQPGHNQAVLVIRGLQPPAQGKTYQCWFESANRRVPADTFSVNSDGTAQLFVNAPEPVDNYRRLTVTVERNGGGSTPSDTVVLWVGQ